MEYKIVIFTEAIGNVNSKYINEAMETRKIRRNAIRLQWISATCVVLAIMAFCTVTALAVKYWVPSWRDLFGKDQTVIGDEDQAILPQDSISASGNLGLSMELQGIISDERILFIPFTLSSKDGTALSNWGRFGEYSMYFPDNLMSGAYQYFFLEPDGEALPGTLGGVFYANWQAEPAVKNVVIEVTDWLEMETDSRDKYVTKWNGTIKVTAEIPVTMPSEILAGDIPIDYNGNELTIDRIECSKISIAVYFPGYVDPTSQEYFNALDKDGSIIDCRWSFIAEQSGKECMFWAVFNEPIDPGTVYFLTYNGQLIYSK